MPVRIPQTDPKANYLAHQAEIDAAIRCVLDGGRYILGREVEAFEREFSQYLQVGQAIGVANGTDALQLGLRVCGVGPGDSVLTVSHTAVATVAAVELVGAEPALVDIDQATFTMDCNCLEEAIRAHRGSPLKAIVPVHLYGHPADMPAVMEIAGRHGLRVVEDCAQSHGAALNGRRMGCWGDMAAFSFYPTKNLGALGDGGAVVTNDADLAARARRLREHGWRDRYVSEEPGMNSRLDELQAAILRVKLKYVDGENARRGELAGVYGAALAGLGVTLPTERAGMRHVYHQYVVRSTRRDGLRGWLRERGVATLVHYPVPVHMQPAYRGRLRHGDLGRTERAAGEVVSLPMYPELSAEAVETVAGLVAAFLGR